MGAGASVGEGSMGVAVSAGGGDAVGASGIIDIDVVFGGGVRAVPVLERREGYTLVVACVMANDRA